MGREIEEGGRLGLVHETHGRARLPAREDDPGGAPRQRLKRRMSVEAKPALRPQPAASPTRRVDRDVEIAELRVVDDRILAVETLDPIGEIAERRADGRGERPDPQTDAVAREA